MKPNLGLTDLFKNNGLCHKDRSWSVIYQNTLCKNICGKMVGKTCDKNCVRFFHEKDLVKNSHLGIELFKNKIFANQLIDLVLIFNSVNIITVLCPKNSLDAELLELKGRGLSNRELEIVNLRRQGFKNVEIEEHLHIAHSTLKTHINNIRKKIYNLD